MYVAILPMFRHMFTHYYVANFFAMATATLIVLTYRISIDVTRFEG